MAVVEITTIIESPIERCFDLARSVDFHVTSAAHTNEQAVGGVTTGLVSEGDIITWRGRHLGWTFNLTSEIVKMDRPHLFVDRMQKGPFASFEHEHWFGAAGKRTVMCDVVRFSSPLGVLGRLVDWLVLKPHLHAFLASRNAILRKVVESPNEWQRYIGA